MENRVLQTESEEDVRKSNVRKQCLVAMIIWCIAGWGNAAITWHLLWLPGLLIFIPGIFLACIIAVIFFLPLSRIMEQIRAGWETYENRNWNLLVTATVLKVFLYLGPLIGSVFYVHILRTIIE